MTDLDNYDLISNDPLPQFVFRPTIGTAGRVPVAAQPWISESDLLNIDALTPKDGFASEEELNAMLLKYMPPGKRPKFPKPKEPWHQAQEIAYRGWEEKSASKRTKAAQKAIKISPDGVDPYLLLAHDAPSWEEALDQELKALAAAERLIGSDPYTEYQDLFWGTTITRPYMRTRFAIGYNLWKQNKIEESLQHFQDLLKLNPGDNQGARYILTAILLEKDERGAAQRLIAQYSGDNLCHWSYVRVLLHFRRKGDTPACRDLLRQALISNPYVPYYLFEMITVESMELDTVEIGEHTEALEHYQIYSEAWRKTENALDWMETYLSNLTH
jgi:tetratricopeptide (TPR) repeat protein